MSENEMVERVAGAIASSLKESFPGHSADNVWYSTGGVVDCMKVARAAIEAMREPTEAMVKASSFPVLYATDEIMAAAWRAGIAAALNPLPQEKTR